MRRAPNFPVPCGTRSARVRARLLWYIVIILFYYPILYYIWSIPHCPQPGSAGVSVRGVSSEREYLWDCSVDRTAVYTLCVLIPSRQCYQCISPVWLERCKWRRAGPELAPLVQQHVCMIVNHKLNKANSTELSWLAAHGHRCGLSSFGEFLSRGKEWNFGSGG